MIYVDKANKRSDIRFTRVRGGIIAPDQTREATSICIKCTIPRLLAAG